MADDNQIPVEKSPTVPKQANLADTIPQGEKLLAAIGYLSFLCVLPIVLKPNSKFCQFHGKQGLVLTILFFLSQMLFGSLSGVFGSMLNLLHLIVAVVCIMAAFKGKKFQIPMVSDMAQKLKW